MIRVTADTNIYISSFVFAGVPQKFIDAAEDGHFELAISEPLIAEVRRILLGKFAWPEPRIIEALSQLAGCIRLVRPSRKIDAVPTDPDDNRVLECAVESGSGFIVSGDNDLLRLVSFEGIRIVRVAEFMALLPTL